MEERKEGERERENGREEGEKERENGREEGEKEREKMTTSRKIGGLCRPNEFFFFLQKAERPSHVIKASHKKEMSYRLE